MKLVLIADAFPPLRTSCAVLWRDLALELQKQGHQVTVLVPSIEIKTSWVLENIEGVEVLRLKSAKTKDVNYLFRTINECLMAFKMQRQLRKSPLSNKRWDGVVWYSPTIFLGPLARSLKKSSKVRSYLVIRDIFPDWALDMRLLRKGLPYWFFKVVERFQYSVADVIGVQTPANLKHFDSWEKTPNRKLEVLHNWLTDAPNISCRNSILEKIHSFGERIIFVYAGNMGVAQGMDILIELVDSLRDRKDIGFLFVGRGSEVVRLQQEVSLRALDNIEFHEEIEPSEIPGLFSFCHVGLLALDPRHKTHNIPGKFLAYMQAGLPVLASINPGNDLAEMILQEQVGRVSTISSVDILQQLALELVNEIVINSNISSRCIALSKKQFSSQAAAQQIVAALS